MSNIVRVKKNKNYFTASNEPFNDPQLSFGARGIMAYLLSKPDDWEVRNDDLYKQSPAGRAAIDRMLRELMNAGYIRRYKANDDKGLLRWVTEVYESKDLNPDRQPNVDNQTFGEAEAKPIKVSVNNNIPNAENQAVGEPNVEKTDVGKPNDIVSTEFKPSTDKSLPNGKDGGSKKKADEKKQLMGAFQSVTGLKMPHKKSDIGQWWANIAEIYHIVDDDVGRGQQLIKDTVADMRRGGLTISSPRSIVNPLRAMAAGTNGANYGQNRANQTQPRPTEPEAGTWAARRAAKLKAAGTT